MSLISLRNVLEPVTNKVHLITLFLLVLIFMVLRLSNGGLHFETQIKPQKLMGGSEANAGAQRAAPAASTNNSFDSSFDNTQRAQKPKRMKSNNRTAGASRSGFLDDLIARPKKKAPAKAPAEKRGGLDDIERELGLR